MVPRLSTTIVLAAAVLWAWPDAAIATRYTIGQVPLRARPADRGRVLRQLDANQTVVPIRHRGPWLEVRTLSGARGFVPTARTTDRWIKVHKAERQLLLLRGDRVIARYRVALSPHNPLGDKVKQGDGGTPEGRFFIAELLRDPRPKARYGSRSMRLSYPNAEDARRGLRSGLIDRRAYWRIVRAIRAGETPDQRTRLGSSIRIHGGGSDGDWTAGCIALSDADAIALFEQVRHGTRVEVYQSEAADRRINRAGQLSRAVLRGAEQQLKKPALYTGRALGLIPIKYPGGDIRADWAVCTDVVIRALRLAGLDLQALVHEDARLYPKRYKPYIRRRPNPNIDHRRSRTVHRYLTHHAVVLPDDRAFAPGDIVIMDTGIDNGTRFDHIGIVDDDKTPDGQHKVINIWTVGYRTSSMALIGQRYPTIVGHFRLTHPFDY